MKYWVGKYEFAPEKPFPSMEKAVQYIQDKYPELDKQTVEKHLTPKVESDGHNKSDNSTKEDSDSQTKNAEDSSAVADRVKSASNKSR